ncbi:leucine-rich repeats and immunoglobulin-like domains protein 2 [Phlebotomus argentipes]|uniref:leucine-rich repeats and immunoglobulin-like domains protein 2 n=1 Tax=Phlebotomus argentipes TaxID=94469 RepID=UPI0028929A68|nr:leucine-rich repeats and immunoglobulin-like domains protein 2 [Phlebotomus argentipes]
MLFANYVLLCSFVVFIVPSKGEEFESIEDLLKSPNPGSLRDILVIGTYGRELPGTSNHTLHQGFDCENFLEKFTSVETLGLMHVKLLSIGKDCFEGLDNLKNVVLFGTSLTNIRMSVFRTSYDMSITYVNLGFNYITNIEFGSVVLPGLKTLSAVRNRLTTVHFTSQNMPAITHLNLAYNHISSLMIESQTLTALNLTGNRLKTLQGLFLPDLQYVDLMNNQLSRVTPDMFASMRSLKQAILSRNPVQSVHFMHFNTMEYLELAGTGIVSLYDIKSLSKIDMLDLSFNNFWMLGYARNSDNPRPFDINMFRCTHCNIHYMLPFFLANAFPNLEKIKLNYNYLTTAFIFMAERDFEDLSEVYLQDNKISRIGSGDFSRLTYMEMLDLRSNDINTIEEGAFDETTKLSILELANNMIFQLPANLFEPINLRELNLNGNIMPYFPIPGWQENTEKIFFRESSVNKLKKLQINNNPLQCQCVDLIRKWTAKNNIELTIDNSLVRSGLKPACIVNNEGCRADVGLNYVKDNWHLFNDGKLILDTLY